MKKLDILSEINLLLAGRLANKEGAVSKFVVGNKSSTNNIYLNAFVPEINNIILLGAGGTGGYFLQMLSRYLYGCMIKGSTIPRVVVVDGDVVERKNLLRQAFTEADLGVNKAEAVQRRYSQIFGIPIFAFPDYFDGKNYKQILDLCDNPLPYRTLVVGASDNHKARLFMWSLAEKISGIWVDAGNDTYHGQVICGTCGPCNVKDFPGYGRYPSWEESITGATDMILLPDLPTFFDINPDEFLKISTVPDVPQNECAVQAEENPQTMQANTMSALCASNIVIQILEGALKASAIYFDSSTGKTKPVYLSQKSIFNGLIARAESRHQIGNFLLGLCQSKKVLKLKVKARFPWLYTLDVDHVYKITEDFIGED